jgi:hypothetical protein
MPSLCSNRESEPTSTTLARISSYGAASPQQPDPQGVPGSDLSNEAGLAKESLPYDLLMAGCIVPPRLKEAARRVAVCEQVNVDLLMILREEC